MIRLLYYGEEQGLNDVGKMSIHSEKNLDTP